MRGVEVQFTLSTEVDFLIPLSDESFGSHLRRKFNEDLPIPHCAREDKLVMTLMKVVLGERGECEDSRLDLHEIHVDEVAGVHVRHCFPLVVPVS